MFKILKKIDLFILNIFIKICHSIQKITGLNNYFLAKVVAWLIAACTSLNVTNYYYRILHEETSLFFCILCIIYTVVALIDAYSCDKSEKDIHNDSKVKRRFILQYENYLARIFILYFALLFLPLTILTMTISKYPIYEFLGRSLNILLWLFSYLVAIEPLPPNKSKIKQIIENLLNKPVLAINTK